MFERLGLGARTRHEQRDDGGGKRRDLHVAREGIRLVDAAEGQAAGLSHYLVGDGAGLAKGLELARKVAANAPLSNYAITQALPRIAEMAPAEGLFVESLMSAIAQGDEAAKQRVRDFLGKRAGMVGKAS